MSFEAVTWQLGSTHEWSKTTKYQVLGFIFFRDMGPGSWNFAFFGFQRALPMKKKKNRKIISKKYETCRKSSLHDCKQLCFDKPWTFRKSHLSFEKILLYKKNIIFFFIK